MRILSGFKLRYIGSWLANTWHYRVPFVSRRRHERTIELLRDAQAEIGRLRDDSDAELVIRTDEEIRAQLVPVTTVIERDDAGNICAMGGVYAPVIGGMSDAGHALADMYQRGRRDERAENAKRLHKLAENAVVEAGKVFNEKAKFAIEYASTLLKRAGDELAGAPIAEGKGRE